MPGVEIRAVYEIIVSHAPELGICALNPAIPTFPPQCLTVTEGLNIKINFLGLVIPTDPFLYNPTSLRVSYECHEISKSTSFGLQQDT